MTARRVDATRASLAEVLVYAAGRDAQLSVQTLVQAGVTGMICMGPDQLMSELSPQTGTLVLAEELITPALIGSLAASLGAQPAWSDLPIVLVVDANTRRIPLGEVADLGNVSLVQRPMSRDALVSTVQAALRARRRQWQVRDLLQQQRAEAERKDQFIAMLAHELRNPLTPIRYAAHLLQSPGTAESKRAQLAQVVERQVGHMGRIIDQLLDVSRVTRGLIRLERGRLDLCQLARDTVSAHAIAAQSKAIVVTCDCECGMWVDGDGTRLRQVLDNLIDNAIKFSPERTQVNVRVAVLDGKVRLTVADQGDGIEKHLQPLLFNAFVQADRSLERSRGGLGLGLALVKGLVEIHSGSVWVESDGPGRGSVFTVELPLAKSDADASPSRLSTPTAAHAHVLVAEDNVDAAESLQMILEGHGYQVQVVHTGLAAAEALGSLRPDALICDIGLPGISGYDVARAAAAGHRPKIMVAVTGYGSPDDRANALAAGFDAHLSKPIAVPDLLDRLAEALAA